MSASYWTSTQRFQWQHTKESLDKERQKLWILEYQLFPQGLNIVIDPKPNNLNLDSATKNPGNNVSLSGNMNVPVTKNIPISHRDLHYDKDFNLRIYCYFLIMKLGRRLNIRQCALATAQIYLSRFLIKVSIREINLYLLVTTCVYLACKVEECPQYIRTLVSEARSLWPEFIPPDPTKITEFEFYLIEELESYLIVHHSYTSMEQIINILNDKKYNLVISSEDIQNCWSLINDSYISDVHLLYPPHVIAMACLFITICIRGKVSKSSLNGTQSSTNSLKINNDNYNNSLNIDRRSHSIFNRFMAESHVDLDEVMDTIQELITLYDHWDKYHESWIKFLLHTLYLRPNRVNQPHASITPDNL
ncbi:hypothetical protein TPHA_0C03450 [Tetrapisispora phaffii CBS 4417]|uniref:RNA polymerase II holoenzyme cyclin-like subunit n=1 Tax=Tetrapisispora phaffii (strain ATCC 24235 / CBS 4417 / NBRC 1672 / NRRL Y-8282 / UCD 70-5) TaxID=1071381 RepID=G8BRX1_TETPH|nr:hypothetical protein TPHA_0C03450 [Tetrapisispora phaffii CBS 4417]CCE62497.1 hypothetical protein TPHA_0C03450 [Tetrapisispora phaffii CBS 4417]